MKLTVNLGEDLKYAKLTHPTTVPVFKNEKFVGECVIDSSRMGELNIVDIKEIEKIKDMLELGVGGTISSREGNSITGFNIKEVSLQLKQKK